MNEQQERQSEHRVTFSDFEEFSAGKPGNGSIKAQENRYRRIIAAELAAIAVLAVAAGALLIALRRIPDWKEPEEMTPVIESVAESVPEAEESAEEEESEESQVWYHADYASEPQDDIKIARNDMMILPSGSTLREIQIDREAPEQYFFAVDVAENDTVYPRIAGKFFREEEPLPEIGRAHV